MALTDNLVAYWALIDAGTPPTTADDSHSTLDGTNANITAGTSGGVNNGRYYSFNGTSSDVDMGTSSSLKLTTAVSVSLWFMSSSTTSNMRMAGNDGYSSSKWFGYYLGLSGGQVRWSTADWTNTQENEKYSGTGLANSVWHHAVGTFDSTNNRKRLYIDGSAYGGDTTWNYDISYPGGSEKFHLGNVQIDGGWFNGYLNHVAVWSRELTSAEVTSLYKNGSTDALIYPFGSTSALSGSTSGKSENNKASFTSTVTLTSGLYGYWKLDETSGNAADSTGNGYTGTSSNITYDASGKISRCFSFNGTTSKVVIGNYCKPTTALSFSVWLKDGGQTTERHVISNTIYDTDWRGWRFTRYNNTQASVILAGGVSTDFDQAFGTDYNNDAWHHVVFTWNGTTAYVYQNGTKNAGWTWANTISYGTTHNLTFGANDSGGVVYAGEIDEIAIWNRALTDAEAATLYNSGYGATYPWSVSGSISGKTYGVSAGNTARLFTNQLFGVTRGESARNKGTFALVTTLTNGLMGWWGLDEQAGSTCYDDTANNLDGTGYNITYGTNGKIDDCYSFNGSSSYVAFGAVAQPTAGITISAWVQLSGHPSEEKWIIHNEQYSTNWYGYRLSIYATGSWGYVLMNGAGQEHDIYISTDDVADGTWHHLVFTWNGTTSYHYTDGVKGTGGNWGYTLAYSTAVLEFGRALWTSHYYGGYMDLVGIWNRALTDTEVANLYYGGAGLDYPFGVTDPINDLRGIASGSALLYGSFVGVNTYYCDPNGSDTTGNGSIGNPWYRPSYACSQVTTSGYVIHVNQGNYTDNNRCNLAVGVTMEGYSVVPPNITTSYVATGTFDAYIYVNSASGNAVNGNQTIRYININGNNLTATRAIAVNFRSNVKIQHCSVQNFYIQGIQFYGTNQSNYWVTPTNTIPTGNEISDCVISNNSSRNAGTDGGGVRSSGQRGMIIRNNTLTQNTRAVGYNGNIFAGFQNYGLQVYGNTFTKTDNEYTTDLEPIYTWNFFMEFHYSHGGIDIYDNEFIGVAAVDMSGTEAGTYSYGGRIYDNIFRSASGGLAPYNPHNEPFIDLESFYVTEDVYIFRNRFSYGRTAIYLANVMTSIDNIHIYDNIIENVGNSDNGWDNGILINSSWDDTNPIPISNVYIYNNVITAGKTTLNGINVNVVGTITNLNIRNNIIYGTFGRPITFASPGTPTINTLNINNNIFYGNTTTSISYDTDITYNSRNDSGNLAGSSYNPSFVGGSPYDFHLSSASSPAYRAGMDVDLLSDYDNNLWASPPSIGAYEYGTGSSSVPDTYDFCLSAVIEVVNPTTDDLEDCFNDAISDWFDPVYEGNHDRLSNFRNYGALNAPEAELQGIIYGIALVRASFVKRSLIGNTHGIALLRATTGGDFRISGHSNGTSLNNRAIPHGHGRLYGNTHGASANNKLTPDTAIDYSYYVEVLDLVSYNWFSGDQPGLGATKTNWISILYMTGVNYDDSSAQNITREVRWQSDDSVFFNSGASNYDIVNTQRPDIIEHGFNYSYETMMDPGGLYFYLYTNPQFYSNNPSVTISDPDYVRIRRNFDLVAGATTPCTLVLDITSMEYTNAGAAISADHFHVTTSPSTGANWFCLTHETHGATDYDWITPSQWYGIGTSCTVSCSTNTGVERTGYLYCRAMTGRYFYNVTVLQRANGYSTTWLGYISLDFDYNSGGYTYVVCTNDSTVMNSQQKTFYWQTRDGGGDVVSSGSFASSTLNAGQSSNHNFYTGSSGWVSCYASVNQTDWYYLCSL